MSRRDSGFVTRSLHMAKTAGSPVKGVNEVLTPLADVPEASFRLYSYFFKTFPLGNTDTIKRSDNIFDSLEEFMAFQRSGICWLANNLEDQRRPRRDNLLIPD